MTRDQAVRAAALHAAALLAVGRNCSLDDVIADAESFVDYIYEGRDR